jgi:hypothetical protein
LKRLMTERRRRIPRMMMTHKDLVPGDIVCASGTVTELVIIAVERDRIVARGVGEDSERSLPIDDFRIFRRVAEPRR